MLAIYVKPQLKSPEKIKGVLRVRFDEQLESFKQDGTLSSEQAELLRTATRFPLNSTELLSILGGLFVLFGIVWLIGPLFGDLSQLLVAAILYLIFALLSVATKSLSKKPQLKNLAEVIEVLAVTSFSIATGFLVAQTDAKSEVSALVASLPALFYGWRRSKESRFSGSTTLATSALIATLSGLATIDQNSNAAGASLTLVGAVLLWWAEQTTVKSKFVLRLLATSIVVVGGFTTFSLFANDIVDSGISLIFAVVLFGYGIKKMYVEVITIAGFGLLVSEFRFVTSITDDSGLQGLATLVVGVVILLFALRKLRSSRTKPLN